MKKEEMTQTALKPEQVNRNRGLVKDMELKDLRIDGKPWPWTEDRFFVVREHPYHVVVEVRTPHDTRYRTSFTKADLYTGQVSFKTEGGKSYGGN